MEQGVLPWRKPWSGSANSVVIGAVRHSATKWPSNVRAPSVPYGVYNGTILLAQASECDYRSNFWITNKVVKELGASLVDGEDQPVALLWGADEYIPYSYASTLPGGGRLVYNIDQVKNCERVLGLTILEGEPRAANEKRYKSSQVLLKGLQDRHSLQIAEVNRAAYSPSSDVVLMPPASQFNVAVSGGDGEAQYWATLWHEVIHWTGHPSRLNRQSLRDWGDKPYAFEELIAELGSAFLCARLGIDGELQHESYLDSWCKALREEDTQQNAHLLWAAAKYATSANKFVLSAVGADRK